MYQKMTERLIRLLSRKPFLVGMVHLRGLPGSPSYDNQVMPVKKVYEIALTEATALKNAGMDGLLIENMHDVPYNCGSSVGPDVVAHMTAISTLIRKEFPDTPIGVQVLAAANRQAIAVAAAADLDFVRVEGFVFSHIADEGFINSCAADLLRFRKSIEAENVSIFADVKKKHSSHAITSDISHSCVAEAARFCKADACIVTGAKTGHAPPSDVINGKFSCLSLKGFFVENYFFQRLHPLLIFFRL